MTINYINLDNLLGKVRVLQVLLREVRIQDKQSYAPLDAQFGEIFDAIATHIRGMKPRASGKPENREMLMLATNAMRLMPDIQRQLHEVSQIGDMHGIVRHGARIVGANCFDFLAAAFRLDTDERAAAKAEACGAHAAELREPVPVARTVPSPTREPQPR